MENSKNFLTLNQGVQGSNPWSRIKRVAGLRFAQVGSFFWGRCFNAVLR